jgi:hypothetical protein
MSRLSRFKKGANEGFDPTLNVNLRTNSDRTDTSNMRDVDRLKQIQNKSPSYNSFNDQWRPAVWTPRDQELQNDYNRSEGAQYRNCNGQILASANQYHNVPLRNYPLAPAEKQVWPALKRGNALVEGAFQYDYNLDNNNIPGTLEDVSYLAPYDNKGAVPYENPYGNDINQFAYTSPPYLRPRDAIMGSNNYSPGLRPVESHRAKNEPYEIRGSKDNFIGEYGLMYANDYITPPFNDYSNDNNVAYDRDGPNARPILPRRPGGNIEQYDAPIKMVDTKTSINIPAMQPRQQPQPQPKPVYRDSRPVSRPDYTPDMGDKSDNGNIESKTPITPVNKSVPASVNTIVKNTVSNITNTTAAPKPANAIKGISNTVKNQVISANKMNTQITNRGIVSKISTFANDETGTETETETEASAAPRIPFENTVVGTNDYTLLPIPTSVWTQAATRAQEYKSEDKKFPKQSDTPMDYLPFSDIPVVRYTSSSAVYDPITKSVTFNAPTDNNHTGESRSNGAPTDNNSYYAFDPSMPYNGYDSRTGKVKDFANESRLQYWNERKKVPTNNGGPDSKTNAAWPELTYGPTPIYTTARIDSVISNIKEDSTSGESESIMQGRNKKETFVPSTTSNFRRYNGTIGAQYETPITLMRNGTEQMPRAGQNYTGPGPIEREFNAAAASRSLLNDLNACPSGANREPGTELIMPDYDLQDPRNTTVGRENKYWGVTAEYARNAPYRYRYLRTTPYVLPRETSNGTADMQVAAMARMRQRDVTAIDRQIQNPAHWTPYYEEELSMYENYHSEFMNSNVVYPT